MFKHNFHFVTTVFQMKDMLFYYTNASISIETRVLTFRTQCSSASVHQTIGSEIGFVVVFGRKSRTVSDILYVHMSVYYVHCIRIACELFPYTRALFKIESNNNVVDSIRPFFHNRMRMRNLGRVGCNYKLGVQFLRHCKHSLHHHRDQHMCKHATLVRRSKPLQWIKRGSEGCLA